MAYNRSTAYLHSKATGIELQNSLVCIECQYIWIFEEAMNRRLLTTNCQLLITVCRCKGATILPLFVLQLHLITMLQLCVKIANNF